MSDEPERDGAPERECVEPQTNEKAADSFSVWDEHDEAFGEPAPIPVAVAADTGMPNVMPIIDSAVHPLPYTLELFTCATDRSKFVIRDDWGDVLATFEPNEVERSADGRYRVTVKLALERMKDLIERERERLHYDEKAHAWYILGELLRPLGYQFDTASGLFKPSAETLGWCEVRPVRPQCKHLLQQLRPPAPTEDLEFGWSGRYCTARRTTTGAFMELTDDAMRACSMRDPVDAKGVDWLERNDARQLERSAHRTHLPMFNFTKQLEDERKQDPAQDGIFGKGN